MSVSLSNKSNKSSNPTSRGAKNLKLKLAMSAFKAYDEGCEHVGDNSTKANSTSTAKSKCSYDNEDQKLKVKDGNFEINLVNLSPRVKEEEEFGFSKEEIKKLHAKAKQGKE